ncbi:hypothetical protein BDA99DRAFT_521544 [Phascolomyces articulosus]|uniref:Uncharacterized protein n=1 Tax=Phascolomyces articulosus TaxID=60185 RepID=A0AAD5JSC1_9FUNG|nr:hypothetical protein BDA99DRAFT_521544 [Phascolomyces articulosus]
MPRNNDYGPIALRQNANNNNNNTTIQMNETQDEEDEEEAHEFATYVESDDDDEDPYFMPEHNKKSSTLSFSKLSCSPVQLFRFIVPAFCILVIVVYTITIAVLTHKRKLPTPDV